MLRRVALTTLVFTAALTCAQADVYRWVDEHGEPHYSDQWVPGSEVIKTDKTRPGSSGAPPRATDSKALAAANTQAAAQIATAENARAVQQDVAKSRDARCKQAKDEYTRAITARRVYQTDKGGDRSYMSDADADAYRETLRKSVQELCGSVPQFDPNAPIPEPQPVPEPKVNPADATSN
jgi:hypothetical protein